MRLTPAYTAASRKLDVLISRFITDAISRAANCLYQLPVESAVHFGSEPANMRLNNACLRIEMKFPDVLQKHGARDHAALIAQEIFQKPEFLGLQLDALSRARHLSFEQVHPEVCHDQHRLDVIQRRTPHQCAESCQEFCEGKRLDQIIIAPAFEAFDAVVDTCHGREKKYRHPIAAGPQGLDDRESVELWHHPVNDQNVVVLHRSKIESILAAHGMVRHMPVLFQPTQEEICRFLIVFNQKQVHRPPSPGWYGCRLPGVLAAHRRRQLISRVSPRYWHDDDAWGYSRGQSLLNLRSFSIASDVWPFNICKFGIRDAISGSRTAARQIG